MKNSHKYLFTVLLFAFLCRVEVLSQTRSGLSISLSVDYVSTERLLDYLERRTSNLESTIAARGNRMAAATSVTLARSVADESHFRNALERVRDNENVDPDIYGLLPARKYAQELRTLLIQLKRRQLERRVVATVESYFPAEMNLSVSIPVFVVAMGNEKAAAVVRRVVWQENTPIFVGEEEGEPVILLNLARMTESSPKTEEQFVEVLAVLAHEVFHAAYDHWKSTPTNTDQLRSASDVLLDLVQNEGVAYYLSMQIHWGGSPIHPAWYSGTAKAIETLNQVCHELQSPQLTQERAQELIMNSNLSGSFESNYGATAGMRMAYEIDTRLGRSALSATLSQGWRGFISAYRDACLRESSLPKLDTSLLHMLD